MRVKFESIPSGIIKVTFKYLPLVILIILIISGDLKAQQNIPQFKLEPHQVVVTHEGNKLALSTDCPFFSIGDQIIGGYAPSARHGDIKNSIGEPLSLSYASVPLYGGGKMDIQLLFQWSQKEKLFRKWARYRLLGANPVLIKEITLDKIESDLLFPAELPVPGQSYPIFLRGFFVGIEYPVSAMRMDSGRVVLAHRPGIIIQPGTWYESRKAIYGIAEAGRERQAFLSYVSRNLIPGTDSIHVNYNSWWTAPIVYSEQNILDLEKAFEKNLFLPYNVSLNTFCLDMGWSDPHSIWQIDTTLFPQKFNSVGKAAKRMNTNLGLWISPSNMYSPNSIESKWAKEQGYETFKWRGHAEEFCCLAGRRYSIAFRSQLLDMVKRYKLKQLKFDGYIFDCPETNHGHEPGDLSVEPIAESLIETCRQIHAVSKDTWIEMSCMGPNPSPWWVFYANSTLGTYGDDSPAGRVPSPVFRESYTSSRDYSNLQGATYLLMPISSQEILGIIHQTPEAFTNDAVTTIMRGHAYLPLYVNPKFMDPARWKQLADIISWAKKNKIIKNTSVLLPESWEKNSVPKFTGAAPMPREPYGYAHCNKKEGLILLRNPWIANGKYELKIDSATGFSKNVKNANIVSLYPEVRNYAKGIQYGDTINIPLAPYETLLLSISENASLKDLRAGDSLLSFGRVVIDEIKKTIRPKENVSPKDSSTQIQDTLSMTSLYMKGSVEVVAHSAELLILVEGDTIRPKGTISVNGKLTEPLVTGSAQGWTATQYKTPEHWVFLTVPLQLGENRIDLKLNLPGTSQKSSVWVWGKKGCSSVQKTYPNILPQPEVISLESVNLVETFDTHL